MGGGFIQIKYLGNEAKLFTGNPQISYFKSVFKSYNNFGIELIDLIFEAPIQFDRATYCNIPIHGDLINQMYLKLNVNLNVNEFDCTINSNGLFSSSTDGIFYEYNAEGNQDLCMYNYKYTVDSTNIDSFVVNEINGINLYNSLESKLDFSNVTNERLSYSITINGNEYNGEIYIHFLKEDLTKLIKEISFEIDEFVVEKHNTDWLLIYNELFNNNDGLYKVNNELRFITPKMFNKNVQLYIPLRFSFTKQTTTSLPIAALYHSDVNVKILTNKRKDIFLTDKIINSVDINACKLATNYVYLDKSEKSYFIKTDLKLLIEQVQHQNSSISNGIHQNIELHFTFLSKYLIWKLPYKYVLNKGKIVFNNTDLFYEQDGEYFHLIQMLETGLGNKDNFDRMENNKNKNGTYYLYSYCLHPKDIQPSGLCNMSRIDDKLLQLETQYIKNDLNINKKIEVDIFNVNYNFLLIQKGKCKLMF